MLCTWQRNDEVMDHGEGHALLDWTRLPAAASLSWQDEVEVGPYCSHWFSFVSNMFNYWSHWYLLAAILVCTRLESPRWFHEVEIGGALSMSWPYGKLFFEKKNVCHMVLIAALIPVGLLEYPLPLEDTQETAACSSHPPHRAIWIISHAVRPWCVTEC